jgi:hypothetical protein
MNSKMKNDHCTKSKPYGFYRTNWQTFCSSVFMTAVICPIAARDRKIKQELFMQNASSVCFSNLQVEFFASWRPWELTGNLQAAAAIVPYMPLARKTC